MCREEKCGNQRSIRDGNTENDIENNTKADAGDRAFEITSSKADMYDESDCKEYKRKLKYLAGVAIITLSVYVCFRYLLVYVWPFVIGILIALLIEKPVNGIYKWIYCRIRIGNSVSDVDAKRDKKVDEWLVTKSKRASAVDAKKVIENITEKNAKKGIRKTINKNIKNVGKTRLRDKEHRIKSIIAAIMISIISLIIIILLIAAIITGANEVSNFLKNWDYNTIGIRQQTARICLETDEFLGLKGGCCLDTLIMCGRKLAGIMPEKIFHVSVPVIRNVVVAAGGLVVGFISVIYLSTDMNGIRTQIRDSVFAEEIDMIWHEVKRLINVYFKVELRIMLINSAISMIAFFIIKSPYAVMLGIIVGIVDALPVFGTGTILIPWTIISLIMKDFFSAGVVLVAYVITYIVREIMESKCMGDKLGISPFAMLVIIFVGLLVYGIPGFITGPVSYVIIRAMVLRLRCVMQLDGGC